MLINQIGTTKKRHLSPFTTGIAYFCGVEGFSVVLLDDSGLSWLAAGISGFILLIQSKRLILASVYLCTISTWAILRSIIGIIQFGKPSTAVLIPLASDWHSLSLIFGTVYAVGCITFNKSIIDHFILLRILGIPGVLSITLCIIPSSVSYGLSMMTYVSLLQRQKLMALTNRDKISFQERLQIFIRSALAGIAMVFLRQSSLASTLEWRGFLDNGRPKIGTSQRVDLKDITLPVVSLVAIMSVRFFQ